MRRNHSEIKCIEENLRTGFAVVDFCTNARVCGGLDDAYIAKIILQSRCHADPGNEDHRLTETESELARFFTVCLRTFSVPIF